MLTTSADFPSTVISWIRSVTSATQLTSPRMLLTVTHSPFEMPLRFARSFDISTNMLGCISASQGMLRVIVPDWKCSDTRDTPQMIGYLGSPAGASLSIAESHILTTG